MSEVSQRPTSTQDGASRRQFMGQVGKAGLASTVAGAAASTFTAASYAKIVGANDRIRVGFIGVGGMGSGHLGAIKTLKEPNNLEPVAVSTTSKTALVGEYSWTVNTGVLSNQRCRPTSKSMAACESVLRITVSFGSKSGSRRISNARSVPCHVSGAMMAL